MEGLKSKLDLDLCFGCFASTVESAVVGSDSMSRRSQMLVEEFCFLNNSRANCLVLAFADDVQMVGPGETVYVEDSLHGGETHSVCDEGDSIITYLTNADLQHLTRL